MFKFFNHFILCKTTEVKIKAYLFDIIFLLLLLYLSSKTLIPIQGDISLGNIIQRVINFTWLSSPLLFLYFLLRACRLPVLLCSYLLFSIIIIISFINDTKIALTNEPLSFNDIISGVNLTVASRYLTLWPLLAGISLTLGVVISTFLSKRIITTRTNYICILFCLIVSFPYSFSPYAEVIFGKDSNISQSITKQAIKHDVVYFSWDPLGNVKTHGLPMHLIQTSVRKSIPKTTDTERELYLREKESLTSLITKHKTIIYILCESCWYDEKNFKDNFIPLFNQGYTGFRAISPVYGAGTANAEFEMLTGLPSNSDVLSGIIYQEYAEAIKQNADSLASALRLKGFDTFAAHNNNKTFWRRNVIYEKFGFDKFESLSEMGDLPQKYASTKQPWQWQADDYLLYNAALQAIKKSNANGNNIFLNLITMSTHGPFQHNNDSGEGVYTYEVHEAIERLAQFSANVEEIDPDAIIVVYGDHKPALNKFFYDAGVFSPTLFTKTGAKDEDFEFKPGLTPKDYGDVPVLIKAKDKNTVQKLITEANNRPFFCVSALIDKNFIQSGLVSFNYNLENYCNNKDDVDYKKVNMTPPWIYSMALFNN
ncbi:LTA synthase family protein [Citrobacter sp. Marseille-Q3906]|uniref:LTA synthase family protein n=1 Tax=Citrobacter sp. Marseille-Q3906 TaxID=2866574 RepID=UPI001CE40F22|nr:LTA synthase family protein [Citrobacter sp. Marseille-Q3906]